MKLGEVEAEPSGESGEASPEATDVTRVDLDSLHNGEFSQNVELADGDTVFVLRAENVFVFGQVNNPGAYPLRQRNSTVLQALSLAGGVTDRGSTSRIEIVRMVDGERKKLKVGLTDTLHPNDTIMVPQRFF